MLNSLIKAIDEGIKNDTGYNAIVEGANDDNWVVMDYGYIVVHLLSEEARDYYAIEELWSKGKVVLSLQ